uniref:Uncharacterized LOC107577831 n=2 Tax=Sinocyclocheilus grahami TaxID=75366 RepID=A0A672KFX2_SINGR
MAVTEKLIQTVHAYPVLYNASLHDYRSSERRVKAWREVAACVGLSVVESKRRWKTVRDRYIRERRLWQLRKEEGSRRLHYWPHRESLAFLDAHIRRRKRGAEAEAPEELQDESSGDDSRAKSKQFLLNIPESEQQLKPSSTVTPVPPVTQLLLAGLPPALKLSQASASTPQPLAVMTNTGNLSAKTEENEAPKSCEKAARAFDEDELFLLSYVPALKRLTPQKRAAVKMQ